MPSVLIVDDSKSMSTLLVNRIEVDLGFETEHAKSFSEARRLVEKRDGSDPFFVSLLDLNLPDASGVEIVDFFQSQDIPSIVLTGDFSEDTRKEILSRNIIDYIIKENPASITHVVTTIRRVHQNLSSKIMVVDDSSLYNTHIADILKTQLFTVLQARNGHEALNILKMHPDTKMVLTDYNMPDMNGFELMEKIRSTYGKDRMAILAVSGADSKDIISRFLKQGANDFIGKPFSREEFICRININIDTLEMLSKLRSQAHRDYLTGLFNRRYFYAKSQRVLKEAEERPSRSFAIAMIDIDHFKSVNDTYGHDAGDQVLIELARIMRENSKGKDVVARLGGEEFCILFRDSHKNDTEIFFESLRKQVENMKVHAGDTEINFTISIGICTKMADTLEKMLQTADKLLYRAKESGRNRIVME